MVVDMRRRSFLGGILALTVTQQFGMRPQHLPTLHGDGVHDDAPALNALFGGGAFRVDNEMIIAREGLIKAGYFRIGSTVHIRTNSFSIQYCRIECMDEFQGQAAIHVFDNIDFGWISDTVIVARKSAALVKDYS